LLHIIAALALAGPPITTLEQSWINFIDMGEIPMTAPLNWNLTTTDLNGKKVLCVHDSTGAFSSIRDLPTMPTLVGEFGYTLAGAHIPVVGPSATGTLNSIGAYVQPKTATGLTHSRVDVGDNYADGDDAEFNATEAREMSFASNLGVRVDLYSIQARASGFDAFDLSGAMRMTLLIHDPANSLLRINLAELRGTSTGNDDNWGGATDTEATGEGSSAASGDMVWDHSGEMYVLRKGIRPATSMSGGSADVGLMVRTSGGDEIGMVFRSVSAFIQKTDVFGDGTPKVNDPLSGTIFCYIGEAGDNVRDHIDNYDDAVLDAYVRALGGFDTIMISLGLNLEPGGQSYSTNIQTLIGRWNTAHSNNGFDAPKYILDTPYVAGDSAKVAAIMQTSEDAFALAQANGYGFINRARMYNYQNPGDLDQRWPSGDAAAYVMDGGNNLHPNDSTTAQNLARDRLEAFEAENIVTSLGGQRSRVRDGERSR